MRYPYGLTDEERKMTNRYLADCVMRGECTADEWAECRQMVLAAIRLDAEVNGLMDHCYGPEACEANAERYKRERKLEEKVAELEAQIEVLDKERNADAMQPKKAPTMLFGNENNTIPQDLFTRVLNQCMDKLEISVDDTRHMLDVSKPTLHRWLSGQNMPHPALGYKVLMTLLDKIDYYDHTDDMAEVYFYY